MGDPGHFDRHAELYDRARPPYPPSLWERLRQLGLLVPGTRALDLGAGTGQATGALLDAGLTVTAIEPGARLAALLAARFPAVTLLNTTAENAPLAANSFELAVAATSVHWMDLGVVLPSLHAALVPGGHFVVWRNAFGDPRVSTPFRDRIAAIVGGRKEEPRTVPGETETDRWARELSGGGWFQVRETQEFRWSVRLRADEVRDLFTTFSDWTPSEAERAAEAVRELGGSVVEHYLTPMIVLRRLS
ncbi:class I SAM-dependent methyltransferase [Rathayibacter sp. YIM 133350]|uniref:class I SAM-dependent methyltransferase n=1 Tax=Rathayibacter sp. YIM 133350 TaxID=3131992 RepID=UPI00307F1046